MTRREEELMRVKLMRVRVARRGLQHLGERLIYLSTTVHKDMTYGDADYLFGALTGLHNQLGEVTTEDLARLMDYLEKRPDTPF